MPDLPPIPDATLGTIPAALALLGAIACQAVAIGAAQLCGTSDADPAEARKWAAWAFGAAGVATTLATLAGAAL